jgi:poly(3-hydroxyalkanoate) synthetase
MLALLAECEARGVRQIVAVIESWISQYAGGEVRARHPGDGRLKPIEDAPGSYVKVRAAD